MPPAYRIHPGIGIARLGNSATEFCISPEQPAVLPIECDAQGNPLLNPDGKSEQRINRFKDHQGRIKRQAARFEIFVYDEQSPKGRVLKLGDRIEGGGNHGTLVDIHWLVYLANKKAAWYEFRQLEGERGYDPSNHPRRNADMTDPNARQRLIIDPGPRIVNARDRRSAGFDRRGDGVYAATFPPPLKPNSIDTLGELLTDDQGRLLVLGGFGNSGSFSEEFGQPRIDEYANNDGWFDDTSDGPVMARLVMYSEEVGRMRFIDVEYPAWVLVGYPAYVPQILDMVTVDDVLYDLAIREFASRPDLFGDPKQFSETLPIDANDQAALLHWRAGDRQWNPNYKPWFYRDVWTILFRPDEFTYLCNILAQSNYPHNQSRRGTFDVQRLSIPPMVNRERLAARQAEVLARNQTGELFFDSVEPMLELVQGQWEHEVRAHEGALKDLLPKADLARAAEPDVAGVDAGAEHLIDRLVARGGELLSSSFKKAITSSAARFAARVYGKDSSGSLDEYIERWTAGAREEGPAYEVAKKEVKEELESVMARLRSDFANVLGLEREGDPPAEYWRKFRWHLLRITEGLLLEKLNTHLSRVLKEFFAGKLLRDAREKCHRDSVIDPYRDFRQFLYRILRLPGEENQFQLTGKPNTRTHNLPLMPLLAGDNPMSNLVPSKFLRLTDYQLFILKQWAEGKFYNEEMEGWAKPDPFNPYQNWGDGSGEALDRGVLMNLLGGAFCPGGEVGWIIRNPSIFKEPYRIKADPGFYTFGQTAASANAHARGIILPDEEYTASTGRDLSQENNFEIGLQPGDLTKYIALPWQSDFNECTTQSINVTYDQWNAINPASENDKRMKQEEKLWETLWWPAHRPVQTFEVAAMNGGSPTYQFLNWSRGIPQTNAGDLKMVTAWTELPFVVLNPFISEEKARTPTVEGVEKYISVERTKSSE